MKVLGVEIGMTGTMWGKDVLIGAGVGFGYVLLSSILPAFFSLGQPKFLGIEQATAFIIVAVLAPLLEELFFSGAIRNVLVQLNVKPITTAVLVALAFAAFHAYAFTAGFYASVQSPFVGAFLFSILMSATLIMFQTNNLLTSVTAHSVVNATTLAKLVVV